MPALAPNYTFEEAREAARQAAGSAGWDPALGRGSNDIPSHADITKHYPSDQHKTAKAAPCLKDDLKATLDVYDAWQATDWNVLGCARSCV